MAEKTMMFRGVKYLKNTIQTGRNIILFAFKCYQCNNTDNRVHNMHSRHLRQECETSTHTDTQTHTHIPNHILAIIHAHK